MKTNNVLGVIGGLGPMSSAYFYEFLTSHTSVTKDQEHIDILISSRSSTPDRTAFILGTSNDSPLPAMIEEAKRLENNGATMIVLVCNTAHYFIDEIRNAVNVPVPSIIEETVKFLQANGKKTPAILATDGTLKSEAYQKKLEESGLEYMFPTTDEQKTIMDIIYGYVKRGIPVPDGLLTGIITSLLSRGCDSVIAGCTEISLAVKESGVISSVVDPLEVLAYKVIKEFGKTPVGFSSEFENYIN